MRTPAQIFLSVVLVRIAPWGEGASIPAQMRQEPGKKVYRGPQKTSLEAFLEACRGLLRPQMTGLGSQFPKRPLT